MFLANKVWIADLPIRVLTGPDVEQPQWSRTSLWVVVLTEFATNQPTNKVNWNIFFLGQVLHCMSVSSLLVDTSNGKQDQDHDQDLPFQDQVQCWQDQIWNKNARGLGRHLIYVVIKCPTEYSRSMISVFLRKSKCISQTPRHSVLRCVFSIKNNMKQINGHVNGWSWIIVSMKTKTKTLALKTKTKTA